MVRRLAGVLMLVAVAVSCSVDQPLAPSGTRSNQSLSVERGNAPQIWTYAGDGCFYETEQRKLICYDVSHLVIAGGYPPAWAGGPRQRIDVELYGLIGSAGGGAGPSGPGSNGMHYSPTEACPLNPFANGGANAPLVETPPDGGEPELGVVPPWAQAVVPSCTRDFPENQCLTPADCYALLLKALMWMHRVSTEGEARAIASLRDRLVAQREGLQGPQRETVDSMLKYMTKKLAGC